MTKENNKILTREQQAGEIQKFTLFSDVFLTVALKDLAACQYVLRVLTGKKELKVREVRTQYVLSNIHGHGGRLDVLAECEDGSLYNLEIERRDTVDHRRRTRFYGALIDSESLQKGKDYTELPEVTIYYISEKD